MRKAEYQNWLSTRGEDAAQWERHKCIEADALIKRTALGTLQLKLKGLPKPIRDYIMLMSRCNYGSAETDAFLQETQAYPEWM